MKYRYISAPMYNICPVPKKVIHTNITFVTTLAYGKAMKAKSKGYELE